MNKTQTQTDAARDAGQFEIQALVRHPEKPGRYWMGLARLESEQAAKEDLEENRGEYTSAGANEVRIIPVEEPSAK